MNTRNGEAVSPVIGVMLMLVVVIIIAAFVSAFAGGVAGSKTRTPQATIKATFSISDGMTISHAGGDAIPLNDIAFITQNGNGFGPNAQKVTTQKLDTTIITDKAGNPVFTRNTLNGKTSFNPGDTLYIDAYNCTCSILQYSVSQPMFKNTEYGDGPHCYDTNGPWDWQTSPLKYTGGCPALWQLCFRNPDNAGKVFTLQATDRKGNLISKADVKITP